MGKYLDLLFKEGENGLMVVSNEAKLLHKVKELYKRDVGVQVGSKIIKQIANMELAYIAMLLDENHFSGYPEEERRAVAADRAGLTKFPKWKHDELIDGLIADIKEDDKSIEYKLLASARHNAENYLVLLQQMQEYLMKQITLFEKLNSSTEVKDKGELKQLIEEAKAQFKELKGWTKDLSEMFKLLKELDAELKMAKKKEGKKQISRLETNFKLYERKN
jgi:hypothetical protein